MSFSSGYQYIGQSSNIEVRYKGHCRMLRKGSHHSYLLQQHYNDTQELPAMEVLEVCLISKLDEIEQGYLDRSVESGIPLLNILLKVGPPVLRGHLNGNASLTREEYIEIMYLLTNPMNSQTEIGEWYGVTTGLIQHISSGESHKWLKEVDLEVYEKMISLKGTRQNCICKGKKSYVLKDPEGNIHRVTNLSALAREFGLLQPKLSEVLRGTRQHHKGWTKVEN